MAAALPRSILFVCSYNEIRSPMAEGLMRLYFGPLVRAASCGVRQGHMVNPFVTLVMDELGVDASRHRPSLFEDYEDEEPFEQVVTLSPEAHHWALESGMRGAAIAYWPTIDPSIAEGSRDQILAEFRVVRDGLAKRIRETFPPPPRG